MGGGHHTGECPSPPRVEIRENPEFQDLLRMDKSHWPSFLWHGWLPLPSGVDGASPWAGSAAGAGNLLECSRVLTPRACSLSGMCLMSLTGMVWLSV